MASTAQAPVASGWLPHVTPHVKHVVVTAIVAVVAWFGISRGLSVWERVKQAEATQAQQALQQAQKQAAQDHAAVVASQARQDQLVRQVTTANARLAQTIAQRDQALKVSQESLQTATLPALAARLSASAGLGEGEVATTPSGLAITDPGARKVVGALEAGVVAQADLKDTQGQLAGVTQELTGANALITNLRTEASQQQIVLARQQADCDANIRLIKAKARKRGWITATVTYLGGIVSGVLLGRRL